MPGYAMRAAIAITASPSAAVKVAAGMRTRSSVCAARRTYIAAQSLWQGSRVVAPSQVRMASDMSVAQSNSEFPSTAVDPTASLTSPTADSTSIPEVSPAATTDVAPTAEASAAEDSQDITSVPPAATVTTPAGATAWETHFPEPSVGVSRASAGNSRAHLQQRPRAKQAIPGPTTPSPTPWPAGVEPSIGKRIGTVKVSLPGYAYIEPLDGGETVKAHARDVNNAPGTYGLLPGEQVEFASSNNRTQTGRLIGHDVSGPHGRPVQGKQLQPDGLATRLTGKLTSIQGSIGFIEVERVFVHRSELPGGLQVGDRVMFSLSGASPRQLSKALDVRKAIRRPTPDATSD